MLISTIFMWVAIAAGFMLALPCLWLLGLALWPAAARKRTEVVTRGIGKPLLLGLVPLLLSVAIGTKLGKGGISALLPLGVLLLWGFTCADGLATFVGRTVFWPQPSGADRWQHTLSGGLLLVGSALLPLIGWILVFPLIAVAGWGISICSWFVKHRPNLPSVSLSE